MDLPFLLIEALQLALWLALPVLAACAIVGLVLSFFQSALHASDPSLVFVPKWFAALGALWLSQAFVRERLSGFAVHVFEAMALLGR